MSGASAVFGSALKPIPGDGRALDHWFTGLDPAGAKSILDVRDVLAPILATSPYLTGLAEAETEWLGEALSGNATDCLDAILQTVTAGSDMEPSELGPVLRRAKAHVALLSGLAEIGLVWTTAHTARALSDFADASLRAALGSLMREAARAGRIELAQGVHPADHCGLAIFALGKQGGQELNYSSDIDIVAFFDAGAVQLTEPLEAEKFYTRLLQRIVAMFEERDALGIVFRTDLRLRPDPASTPLAISTAAAMQYYESRGQSWERAAWIKARVAAGDEAVGLGFLDELAPFVWRKHLDFATIADVQALKRQINLSRGIGDEWLEGHNVKLGRGGIREIEFFTQTQQLIAGGRDRTLRVRSTTDALGQLLASSWISPQTAHDLLEAYWYLRAVENRLQMRRDEQTHSLPDNEPELEIIAAMMGADSLATFKQAYRAATNCVISHYAELFSTAEPSAPESGRLVFTGNEDDPATLDTLSGLGFAHPATAVATIRKWNAGAYSATRADASRRRIAALIPTLLQTMSDARNADDALARFDSFISRLPAGVQLFSLLSSHENLCRLLVTFMASAPRLAEEVIHRAHIMDGLIDPAFSVDINRLTALVEKVDDFLLDARSYEDLIDRTRLIGQEQQFLISAGLISGAIDAVRAGQQFSALAQTLLDRLFAAVRREFEQRHGQLPGAQAALLAFGKMASGEMTATSDLDFILLFRVPEHVEHSTGEKPLAPSHYYTRLTQRLLAALSAPTAAGVLYEADMRLRPSGNKGPLATPLSGFRSYQIRDAWTWEHLALSRARVIFADSGFDADIHAVIAEVLTAPRDRAKTIAEVMSMRARMLKERGPRHEFDLKLAEGGLIDIEFIAQSAMVLKFTELNLPHAPAPRILSRMGELGWLPEAERLIAIHTAYATVLQTMSTCLVEPFRDDHWTDAFRDLLARLTNSPDFAFLQADIAAMRAEVRTAADAWYARAALL